MMGTMTMSHTRIQATPEVRAEEAKKTPHILRCIITALRKGSGVDIVMGAGKCISSLNPVLLCLRYPHPRLAQSPQIKV